MRPASEPKLLLGIKRQRSARVVHQVATNHVGTVSQAAGKLIGSREQQESWAFDAVGGNDECLASDAVGVFVRIVVKGRRDGALFIVFALRLRREPTERAAMALFRYSITYLSLLFVAMAGDVLVRFH